MVYVWALEQQTDSTGMSNYLSASRVHRRDQLQPDLDTLPSRDHTAGDMSTARSDNALDGHSLVAKLDRVELTASCNTNNSKKVQNSPSASNQVSAAVNSHSLEQRAIAEIRNTTVSSSSTASVASHVGGLQLPVHVNRTHFEAQDVLVPWHLKNKQTGGESRHRAAAHSDNHEGQGQGEGDEGSSKRAVQCRYYHVFCQNELESHCGELEYNTRIVNSYYDKGNWCMVVEKC